MSHDLAMKDGQAQMFSVAETPWHGLGQVLTDAPNYDDAIRMAGLATEIVKRPFFLPASVEGEFYPSKDSFYTTLHDQNVPLGMVSKDYEVVQNLEAFRVLQPLLDQGLATLETGGSLRGGARAWLMTRWTPSAFGPEVEQGMAEVGVLPFSALINDHTGRAAIRLLNTDIRVVCRNTLDMAVHKGQRADGRMLSVPHLTGAKVKLVDEAEAFFGKLTRRYERLVLDYAVLRQTALDEQAFEQLVLDIVAPSPLDDASFNPEAKLASVVIERAEMKRAELTRLWTEGKGHTGDHSAWEAYNGAVEALDHNAALWPTRGGAWRGASLLDGTIGDTKRAVLDGLVRYAEQAA